MMASKDGGDLTFSKARGGHRCDFLPLDWRASHVRLHRKRHSRVALYLDASTHHVSRPDIDVGALVIPSPGLPIWGPWFESSPCTNKIKDLSNQRERLIGNLAYNWPFRIRRAEARRPSRAHHSIASFPRHNYICRCFALSRENILAYAYRQHRNVFAIAKAVASKTGKSGDRNPRCRSMGLNRDPRVALKQAILIGEVCQ
jgi:hypothetical protein